MTMSAKDVRRSIGANASATAPSFPSPDRRRRCISDRNAQIQCSLEPATGWTLHGMAAKIVQMPPPVQLTEEDLEIAERACRSLARGYRRSAERQMLAALRDSCLGYAAHFETMADRIQCARNR